MEIGQIRRSDTTSIWIVYCLLAGAAGSAPLFIAIVLSWPLGAPMLALTLLIIVGPAALLTGIGLALLPRSREVFTAGQSPRTGALKRRVFLAALVCAALTALWGTFAGPIFAPAPWLPGFQFWVSGAIFLFSPFVANHTIVRRWSAYAMIAGFVALAVLSVLR
ncbi:hypothetical protein D9V32_02240 [Mycetocola tolaasinivorans]|uniref:Uncharacterized protein n=2 Tax=Mycetocola tolaasinivorans TaxID=76635 RepID=A0A3L7ABF2_9MICO|nr:hypothetical protein D9V32_02240 [Mycetocola tolaasinivorans]